ncbi:hypothetical protein AGRA3207_000447 [Actinomadura graeca]|uniref:Uncharacterized protein n=1 Tax=Actinomadura graeca TaxID=2750812 RepID=A0ABX8QMW7_9ACTN|nr:hypothetical protein [Actinomadura graeca]QXJ19845.1 hypothetical protein AGRA3207_000447 [Actinomadura graeca]
MISPVTSPPPGVDLCEDSSWNPIIAAGNWVPVTGGIAGFIFAGLMFLLSTRPARQREAARGFTMLLTAFFGFISLTFVTVAISGERVCARAHTSHAIIGGILALSLVSMCAGLSWIIVAFTRFGQEALSFACHLIHAAQVLSAVMLVVSSTGYVRLITEDFGFGGVELAMVSVTAVFVLAGVALGVAVRRRPLSEKAQGRFVSVLAGGTLAYLAVASVSVGVFLSTPSRHWVHTATWVVQSVAWGGLVSPLLILLVSIGAVAGRMPGEKPAGSAQPGKAAAPRPREEGSPGAAAREAS